MNLLNLFNNIKLQQICINDKLIRLNKFISWSIENFYNLFFYYYRNTYVPNDLTVQKFTPRI